MFNLFPTQHEELDSKIRKLEDKIEMAQPVIGRAHKSDWDTIFELCTEIAADFKNVRYPARQERDIAWQKFFNLRDKAFNVRKSQTHDHSRRHFDELMSEVSSCDYWAFADFVVGHVLSLGLLKTTAEDMKQKGRDLNRACNHFKEVKHEMTGEHKTQIHERILEVRRSHDTFWGQYKSYQQEQSQIYEHKKRNWEEKQQKSNEVRASIERNIESNKDKLYNLRDKIYESNSDNWKSKAQDWLYDLENKIRDIESQISRIEGWIQEGRDKLSSWR
jgi:vacuolar-type H+-ATPase subunit I/STV1